MNAKICIEVSWETLKYTLMRPDETPTNVGVSINLTTQNYDSKQYYIGLLGIYT